MSVTQPNTHIFSFWFCTWLFMAVIRESVWCYENHYISVIQTKIFNDGFEGLILRWLFNRIFERVFTIRTWEILNVWKKEKREILPNGKSDQETCQDSNRGPFAYNYRLVTLPIGNTSCFSFFQQGGLCPYVRVHTFLPPSQSFCG